MHRSLAPIALLLLLPTVAAAGTFEGTASGYFLGNTASMTGGAGTAVLEDADAAWINPAGLAGVTRSSLSLSANAFMLRNRKVPEYLVFSYGDKRSAATFDSRQLVSAPTAIVSVRKLGDGLTLALGLHTPRSDQMSSDLRIHLDYVDEDGERVLFDGREQANLRVLEHRLGAAIGWRAARWLDLGARLGVVYLSTQDRYRGTESELTNPDADGLNPTDLYLSTGGGSWEQSYFGLALTLAARARLPGRWNLALVARSPTMVVYDTVAMVDDYGYATGAKGDAAAGEDGYVDGAYAYDKSNDREGSGVWLLGETRVSLGVSHPIGDGWFAVDAEIRHPTGDGIWSFDQQAAWDVRAGVLLPLNQKMRLGLGLFTDRSVHKTPSASRDMQVHFYGATAGLATDKRFKTTAGSTLIVRSTFALRYAAGFGTVMAEQYDAKGYNWNPVPRDVVFHEVSLQLGSAIHF